MGEEMVRDEAYLINIDSVGKKGMMRGCSSGRLGRRWLGQILKIAEESGVELRRLPFLKGIMMDHLPFCHYGIPSISLTSVSQEGWHLHTRRDRFSLIQKDGLEEMGSLVLSVIKALEGPDAIACHTSI